MADANSRAQLLSYLGNNYRNFYYFGHGTESSISAYRGATTTITKDQVANLLGNVPLSYVNPQTVINGIYINPISNSYLEISPTVPPLIKTVASHPYRFVFLDGCETGRGNFCESFGIPAITVSTNFFAAMKVESRAFLGYKNSVNFSPSQWEFRSIMLANFLGRWESGGVDINHCVGAAQAESFQPMDSSAVIYGAYDLLLGTKTRP